MPTTVISRRRFTLAVLPAVIATREAARAANTDAPPPATEATGLSHTAAAIHQEIDFEASSARLYEALTSPRQFDALTRLSDAVTLLSAPGAEPTAISPDVGGPFTLFGGYITGRNLQMVRGQRLVQAWRAGSWESGAFSIVRFELRTIAHGCRLIFDHRGFPDTQGASLASGWQAHYWEPLAKLLQRG
jgi:activator of HSP90 ATPase